MKKRDVAAIIFVLSCALFACERELEFSVPGPPPRLVVNSIFAQDSCLRIELSTTASPGEGGKIKSLKDASISIYEDSRLIGDIVLDSILTNPGNFVQGGNGGAGLSKFYFHKTINTRGVTGIPYFIRVSYPGLENVTAKTSIPRQARVRQLNDHTMSVISINGQSYTEVSFQLDDNGNGENFYALELLAEKVGQPGAPVKIGFFSGEKAFAENITVNTGQHTEGAFYTPEDGIYFSNNKFKGRNEAFALYVNSKWKESQYVLRLRILTLSSDCFLFATSYQRQRMNNGNPFAEPAQVHSNVDRGLGIFAGYSVAEINIR